MREAERGRRGPEMHDAGPIGRRDGDAAMGPGAELHIQLLARGGEVSGTEQQTKQKAGVARGMPCMEMKC